MILTIDNLDGQGARDYSAALCPKDAATRPLTVERTLNAPSRASGALLLAANPGWLTLPVPVRRARVIITSSASGATLFTGYLATEPVAVYAGAGLAGPVFRYQFSALSDEWLLDKQTATLTANGLAVPAGTLLDTLTNRTAAGTLNTAGVMPGHTVGVFTPEPGQPWSASAGAIASAAGSAYRAVSGALSLNPIGAVTHAVNFDSPAGAGVLTPAALQTSLARELANDVTLTGEIEPAAYVSELFQGDGTTTVFTLSTPPFKLRTAKNKPLTDSFSQGTFNTQLWQVSDPGSHLATGASGLALTGGNGFDGQTMLTAWDPIELGGAVLLEAADVQFNAPSDGVVLGLYSGPVERDNCVAGYNIRQSAGNTVLTPYVNGAEIGTTFTLVSGHRYTLRLRLHSVASQRVLQTYYARVDGAIQAFGGGLVTSPASVVFDVIDLGNASNTPASVLYDGTIASTPASCTFAAVNSLALTGSIGSITATHAGSAWVASTLPGGTTQTRLIGVAGQGVDCTLSATGKLTFFAGRVPVAGELITVRYRTRHRAVARLQDSASVAAEAAGGQPGTARWLGRVLKPAARSSADCEAAAQAVLALASSRAAAQAGSYSVGNPAASPDQDIWPGDALALTSAGQTHNVVARKVQIEDGNAKPEHVTYRVSFANEWAESLGLTLSETIAPDAFLPASAQSNASPAAAVLGDLPQLAVVSTTGNALQIDAGTAPPAGGGFEVRLRDFAFGPTGGQDLVLRSPVRSFSVPRAAQVQRFFVRMYDASTPPRYSRNSSAVVTNLPLS